MPTSIHLPPELLRALERRARELGMSRNRVIVHALQRELTRENEWSPGFFEKLDPLPEADAEVVDDMLRTIRAGRSRKRPPRL
jgi:hypothetical protein